MAVHKSAKAKLLIRNLDTELLDLLRNTTNNTTVFANDAVIPTSQTQIRSQ